MKYFMLMLLFALVKLSAYSATGKVVKLVGEATMLAPHSLVAVEVKSGATVLEDTSILTGKKSLVKILMEDGSIVMIGPNSKMVVAINKKEGSLLNLLKGKVRVEAKKSKNQHLFIKTRTAALGVRGTDFMAMFNPESKRTSLLTFEGSVAFSKDMKKIESLKTDIEKKEAIKKIDSFLNESATLAKPADFTTVGLIEAAPIEPVKINPTQFALLKQDDSLGSVKQEIDKKVLQEEASKFSQEIKNLNNNPEKKVINGGFISTDVGLYIPPTNNDAKSKAGKITTSGDYVPPEGLELDAHRGFVAKDKDDKVAILKATKINENLGQQIVSDPDDPMYKRYFEVE